MGHLHDVIFSLFFFSSVTKVGRDSNDELHRPTESHRAAARVQQDSGRHGRHVDGPAPVGGAVAARKFNFREASFFFLFVSFLLLLLLLLLLLMHRHGQVWLRPPWKTFEQGSLSGRTASHVIGGSTITIVDWPKAAFSIENRPSLRLEWNTSPWSMRKQCRRIGLEFWTKIYLWWRNTIGFHRQERTRGWLG